MNKGGTLSFFATDHLGSTNVVANGSGGLVSRQTYYPFGAPRPTERDPLPTDYTFTGQKLDASVNLMYYGARYYDAALGRFLQPDTIVPNPGDPQSLNRYSYVRNNPVKYNDPTGHCDPDDCSWERDANGETWDTIDKSEFKGYVLILVCGVDTNCATGDFKDRKEYQGQTPLSPLAQAFTRRGGTAVYVPGSWTDGSMATVNAMKNGIADIINDSPNAKGFYLAGHSLGGNGAVVGANEGNSGLKGLALLDPDLADNGTKERVDTYDAGKEAAKNTPTFVGASHYPDPWGWFRSSATKFPMDADVTHRDYYYDNEPHFRLAVDPNVSRDIIRFYVQYR